MIMVASAAEGYAMPMHDWTRVNAGLYHAFRQGWIIALSNTLNAGVLTSGYFALAEQRRAKMEPDLVALQLANAGPHDSGTDGSSAGGTALLTTPPKTRFDVRSDTDVYARKADRLSIRAREGELVAIVEIVSPGNKSSRLAIGEFAEKIVEFVNAGVHALFIDPFPPGPRDPHGIHDAIWGEAFEERIELPTDKPLSLVSYQAAPGRMAYVEPIAVGDALPDMPLFLQGDSYVFVPLEATYRTSWVNFPAPLKRRLEAEPAKS